MNAPRFIAKGDFAANRPLRQDGRLVLDGYATLSGLLQQHGGPDLATLLAEPALGRRDAQGPTAVSWYSPIEGQPVPLTALAGPEREAAERLLRERLHALRPLLSDPVSGALLGRALVIPSLDDVLVIGGQPVLVNWGTVPNAVADTPQALGPQWEATLGPYASFPEPWLAVPAAAAMIDDPTAPPPVAPPPQRPAAVAAEAAAATVAARLPWYQRGRVWAAGSALLFVLGLLLGWLLLTLAAPGVPAGVTEDQLALQRSVNRALEQQIERLRAGLGSADACQAALAPGLSDLDQPVRPLEGGQSAVAPVKPEGKPDASARPPSLADLLDKSTALVVVAKPKGVGIGTAFFVAPGILVTDAHVVDGAAPGSVTVTNKAIGALKPVDVVAQTQRQTDGRDYAILKAREPLQDAAFDLPLTEVVAKLDRVVAAGYPGLIIQQDRALGALIANGDKSAIPDLVATRGEVATIQTLESNGLPAIAHTAIISQGNSGGPLVDECGRVVGINTFITFDAKESPRQGNYAIASSDLIKFLQEKAVPIKVSSGRCSG